MIDTDRYGEVYLFDSLATRGRWDHECLERRDIRPLEYGGWGYRVRPRSTAVVLRGGQALALRPAGGREFAVTVDDADTAAALLNTLADQRRSQRGR